MSYFLSHICIWSSKLVQCGLKRFRDKWLLNMISEFALFFLPHEYHQCAVEFYHVLGTEESPHCSEANRLHVSTLALSSN